MANVIEIRVRATDETGPVYDEVKARSATAGLESGAAFTSAFASHVRGAGGQDLSQSLAASISSGVEGTSLGDASSVGDEIVDSISDTVERELGPRLEDPVKKSGSSSAAAFSSTFQADLGQSLSTSALGGVGEKAGRGFTASFSSGVKDSMQDATLSAIIEGAVDEAATDVLAPESPAGRKIQENAKGTGEQAGQAMSEGMSPLLATAMGAAVAVGAPALLTGMGAAFAGVTALALRNNVVIKSDFSDLGKSAAKSLQEAAAPAAGTLNQALLQVSQTATTIEPQLQSMFVAAEPDITAMTGGLTGLATSALPGLTSALRAGQVDVAAFGNALPGLGAHVGGFFQGLTRDAYTTGAGLSSLVGTLGTGIQTLGGVLGSAATVGSTALLGLDPVLNVTLGLVQKLASPGLVGAAAGAFAFSKLGGETGPLTTGLTSAAGALSKYAAGAVDAEGEATRLGGAAEGMSGALSKGAGIMSGPWGMAIGAGVGLVTGLVGSLINASHASDALTLSQQGLQQAVQSDQGTIGSAVTTLIAAQAQTDGLAASAAKAGVSLQTWTQAVSGNQAAQQQVTNAVDKLNLAQLQQAASTNQSSAATGKYTQEQKYAQGASLDSAISMNQLSDANAQLLNSMHAQAQQIAQAVVQQAQLQAATNALSNQTDIFTASLQAQHQTAVASAQQSSLSTLAALNLGDASVTLSQQLYGTVTAFTEASAQGQAYSTVLQALNGTTMGLDQAQNALAQQMITAKSAFAQNKYSLDLSTQAGVSNRQALVAAAQAITAMGVAQYQASGSIDKANGVIQSNIVAFANATGATGKARQAIIDYLNQIAKIPANTTTTTYADTSQASLALNQLLSQMDQVRNTGVYVAVQEGEGRGYATGGITGAATGGVRGNLVQVGERGRELVRLPYGSTVIPNANVEAMSAGAGGSGGSIPIELQLTGGADSDFLRWLRQAIRVRGGTGTNSVQKALGQTY